MTEGPRRGFASMNRDKQREIASKGGKTAHSKGKAHEFTSEQAREAGRKGGLTISKNRQHMASIGKKGGEAVSRDRTYMAEIGRKGGVAANEDRPNGSRERGSSSDPRGGHSSGSGSGAEPAAAPEPSSPAWVKAG